MNAGRGVARDASGKQPKSALALLRGVRRTKAWRGVAVLGDAASHSINFHATNFKVSAFLKMCPQRAQVGLYPHFFFQIFK